MTRPAPLTASADPAQDVPAAEGARLDRIERAIASLDHEERRLLRIGFELPLARCREQRRYWEFLRGMFRAASSESHDPLENV